MREIQEIYMEKIMLRSKLPIKSIIELKVCQKENAHGTLLIQAVIEEEKQKEVLTADFAKEEIFVFEYIEGKSNIIFRGKIDHIQYKKQNQLMLAEIYGISFTYELDQEKKRQSFQNTNMTYEEIIEQITVEQDAGFLWKTDQNRKIETPIIQYDESNWEFLIRLASHFHTIIIADIKTGGVNFSFGLPIGKKHIINDSSTLEYGLSDIYFSEGGYEEKHSREIYHFLKISSYEMWQMGDFVSYKNECYYVYEVEACFTKGELCYYYTLGRTGVTWKKKRYNNALQGLRLKGIIKKVELESVYLQLEIDNKERANYPWPWVPEIGNHCYCMPETNTKAILYFSTNEENDGLAIHTLRVNSGSNLYQNTQNKELVTLDDKKLCLHSDELIAGAAGNSSVINLTDDSGIHLNSDYKINLSAKDEIWIKAKSISVTSPDEITCTTAVSNIQICKNFNFYAPGGVRTKGESSNDTIPDKVAQSSKKNTKDPEHWQASFSALAAIPAVDFSKMKEDAVVDMASCGAVAKTAKGSATIAMKEVMNGKKTSETTYPQIFRSMDNYTLKGGHPLPKAENR